MNANNLSSQERIERRAAYEQFRMVVCANGYVNIVNQSHNDDTNHTYSVEVTEDGALSCSCPHHQQRNATCKHMVAVTDRPLILSSAQALNQSHQSVATDGGSTVEDESTGSEELPEITHHVESPEVGGQPYARCEGCGVESVEDSHGETSILHDDGCPHADGTDEDGEDSHGVVDVGRCRCGNYVYGNEEYCSERCEKKGPINTAPL
jgi:hypothetical protein